jgi:ketosteroid isomerase-like protein
MTPRQTVAAFYDAFRVHDSEAMAALYSENVEFRDPVFPSLRGKDAKGMWLMLCRKGESDLKLDYTILSATDKQVVVQWDARYTFRRGRVVHNQVLATLFVESGKICHHVDQYSLWKWSAQALGPMGCIFGWTSFFQKKIRHQAARTLQSYMAKA